jgi:membrane-associated phospholipid phosphatase
VAAAPTKEDAVAAAGAALFVALAVLVAVGVVTGLDEYGVAHWMPWLRPSTPRLIHVSSVFVPQTRRTLGGTLVGLWTYPASPFISGLVVAGCAYVALRRGSRRAAIGLCSLWIVANVLELIGKGAIGRPALGGVAGFRHSYPSGHTIRACILAAAIAWTWRRAGPAAAAWALTVPVALVLLGDHTPTDVVGGLALAVCLIALWQRRLERVVDRSQTP